MCIRQFELDDYETRDQELLIKSSESSNKNTAALHEVD